MATLSQTILNVDKGLPISDRYIFLTADAFGGGAGEGDFIAGGGADVIDIMAALGRKATYIELVIEEATGGAGDSYTISLLPNLTYTLYPQIDPGSHNLFGDRVSDWSNPVVVNNESSTILVTAPSGTTISYSQTGNFSSLSIDGNATGAGTLGNFTLLIR